jgi:hypothetical protein
MDKGTISRIGDKPFSRYVLFHVDCPGRTDTAAETASLAGDGIDDKVFPNRIEPASFDAFVAFNAFFLIDAGCLTAPEFETLFYGWVQKKV